MDAVYLCYLYGDFDSQLVFGVAKDLDAACQLIKKYHNENEAEWNRPSAKLIDNGDGTFRIPGKEDDGEEYHYWTKKVKMNKAF